MIFNSYLFLLAFLPLVLIGFNIMQRYRFEKGAIWLLSLSSLLFYSAWNPAYLSLLVASIVANFSHGRLIMATSGPLRFVLLCSGVCLNLGLLAYYKYADFFLSSVANISGRHFDSLDVILPLAISFFTFQQIAYLVDSYRGLCEERSFSRYLLFVSFFPQLIAGPIVHHKEMMPQFNLGAIRHNLDVKVAHGIIFLVLGLAKKVLLADSLAPYAISVFDGQSNLDFSAAWVGTVSYTLQLYFDFSGYTDMAIGLGLLFGIRLPDNFNSPYKAESIIDFWRRWHMTLSRFLRDYLYIPLGGNRKGIGRRYINLALTMLLGGLWHGAAWTFVLWGGLHGALLAINHAWHALQRFMGLTWLADNRAYRIVCRVATLFAVSHCWVVFRAESLERAALIFNAMYSPNAPAETVAPGSMTIDSTLIALLAGSGAIALFAPNIKQILIRSDNTPTWLAGPQRIIAQSRLMAVCFGCLAVLVIIKLDSFSEFLYFQF